MSYPLITYTTAVFSDIMPRERDRIVWRVARHTTVYPVYSIMDAVGVPIVAFPGRAVQLTRDYYCHDDRLYEFRLHNQSYQEMSSRQATIDLFYQLKLRMSELMIYEFPNLSYDPSYELSWTCGFIGHYSDFIVHSVDFEV
jgi:hypothetical protein